MRSPAEIFESVLRPCVWVLIVGLLGLGYAGDALAVYEMTNGGDGVEGDPRDGLDYAGGGGSLLDGNDKSATTTTSFGGFCPSIQGVYAQFEWVVFKIEFIGGRQIVYIEFGPRLIDREWEVAR